MVSKEKSENTAFSIWHTRFVCLLLIVAILIAYRQVGGHDFVSFDDGKYITDNLHVKAGLSLESIKWALTATYASNWHPLTWLSHMLDVQLFGMNPGRHHLVSLIFHVANSLLLFLVLKRMTGAFWQSFLVAALFALHPLNVESVAWISERKNLLSTFFWFLTMWSYSFYVEKPNAARYIPVFLCLLMGLAAKPMLVTLPFVLMLLDYWPFGRLHFERSKNATLQDQPGAPIYHLLREKIPLFVLVIASCIVTFLAQHQGGAMVSVIVLPLQVRIANALISYAAYIGKMLWPVDLAFFYPLPQKLPAWEPAGACLLLLIMTLLAVKLMRRRPYFTVGWFWYLGTLVPVIGFVQVGMQAMADRYAYVPTIGLFIIVAWSLYDIAIKWRIRKIALAVAASLCSVLMVLTGLQARYWADSHTLYEHAVEVTKDNATAHYNLGTVFTQAGNTSEAIKHYSATIRIMPEHAEAHNNLGNALTSANRMAEAIDHYKQALRINPDFAEAHNNMGIALEKTGRTAEAVDHYAAALQADPNYPEAHMNLAIALADQGKVDEAINHFQQALALQPEFSKAMFHLAKLYISRGEYQEAVSLYQKMITLLPDNPAIYYNVACIRAKQDKPGESVVWLKKAVAKGFDDWEHIKIDVDLDNIRDSDPYKAFIKSH